MNKDILQQLHQQEWGFPVDADVAEKLDAENRQETQSDAPPPPQVPSPQFTDDNPFGL